MKRGRERVNVATTADGKEKVWAEQADAGMDELMAVLGYKIKSSDMANVAEKIEQLEMAAAADEGASVLSADAVHYNPSDLPAWVESMLSELSNSCCFDSILGESSSDEARFISDDDLRAIPGEAVFSNRQKDSVGDSDNVKVKRVKSELSPGSEQLYKNPPTARPMLMVDSQETGVRLVHTLMACAEAVQQGNAKLADALVKHVGILAVAQIGAMRKVATYFGEALARRIYNIHPPDPLGPSFSDALQMHFYETVPYLKFAHFTANQAILEAFAGAAKVHVIDFGLKQGTQWPALLQALALRPGGPPAFRLTGIGPPQPDNADSLQEVGWKLAQLAQAIGIEFEFRGFVANSLADLDADVLEIRLGAAAETIAVNSVLEFHRLLSRPGAVEKVLSSIRALNPRVVTLVEHEASHNGVVFLERFNEALHYYSTMFDSVESARTGGRDAAAMAEAYLGRQICNVVACEGSERVERHEPLGRWRSMMSSAGFGPVHLGSDAFKQARMLLALFGGGDGYRVEENGGCLMLGWHTRPLIATSAWRPAAAEME